MPKVVKTVTKKSKPKPTPQVQVVKPEPVATQSLYAVYFTTPHTEEKCFVVQADSPSSAKALLEHVLKCNPYCKVNLADKNWTDAIFLSETITITRATPYRG